MDEKKRKLWLDQGFFTQSIRCQETHSISRFRLGDFPELVMDLLQVKTAAALANADSGHISTTSLRRIVKSCEALQSHIDTNTFMVDVLQGGGGFAINTNVNEAIVAFDALECDFLLSISDVNKSQSSSDVCATALRLTLHRGITSLIESLDDLISSLHKFSEDYGQTRTLARTCWQDALPITIGERFNGISDSFIQTREELLLKAMDLLHLPLGSTVLGTGYNASISYQERVITHLETMTKKPVQKKKNAVMSAQNFPDLAHVAMTIKMLCHQLIRFGLDLRLLSSGPQGGLFEISLPKVMPSSSFFKDKFNPTIVETAIQSAVFGQSLISGIELYRLIPEIDLNVFEWSSGMHLWLALEPLIKAIQSLNRYAISGMAVNALRCQELSQYAHEL